MENRVIPYHRPGVGIVETTKKMNGLSRIRRSPECIIYYLKTFTRSIELNIHRCRAISYRANFEEFQKCIPSFTKQLVNDWKSNAIGIILLIYGLRVVVPQVRLVTTQSERNGQHPGTANDTTPNLQAPYFPNNDVKFVWIP